MALSTHKSNSAWRIHETILITSVYLYPELLRKIVDAKVLFIMREKVFWLDRTRKYIWWCIFSQDKNGHFIWRIKVIMKSTVHTQLLKPHIFIIERAQLHLKWTHTWWDSRILNSGWWWWGEWPPCVWYEIHIQMSVLLRCLNNPHFTRNNA